METFIKENLKMIIIMDKEHLLGQMETFIKENIKMIKEMDKVH